jgi:hypothetical protein
MGLPELVPYCSAIQLLFAVLTSFLIQKHNFLKARVIVHAYE